MAEQHQYTEGYRGPRTILPAVLAAELDRIAGQKLVEELTAEEVLTASTPEDAPLHPQFTWDNDVAGHKWRLVEARTLIRAVVKVPEPIEGVKQEPERIWVHVPAAKPLEEGKYVRLSHVAENADEYQRALGEAIKDLESAERRFHELRRLAEKKGGKTEALAIAMQGFNAVKEAMVLLRG